MTKFIAFSTKCIAITVVALLFTSCHININNGIDGNGNVTRQNRPLGNNFSRIEVSRGLNVILEQGDKCWVEVEADENLQNHILVKLNGTTLVITSDENIDEATAKNIHVKTPMLTAIEATSGAEVSTPKVFAGSVIDVKTSSGSTVDLYLEFESIQCEASSGSEMNVKGKTLELHTTASSGSSINADQLFANDVIAQSTSGSSINVRPSMTLDAKASSGSSIDYSGSPETVTK